MTTTFSLFFNDTNTAASLQVFCPCGIKMTLEEIFVRAKEEWGSCMLVWFCQKVGPCNYPLPPPPLLAFAYDNIALHSSYFTLDAHKVNKTLLIIQRKTEV